MMEKNFGEGISEVSRAEDRFQDNNTMFFCVQHEVPMYQWTTVKSTIVCKRYGTVANIQ